jgi:RNA-directed DNA polymerase
VNLATPKSVRKLQRALYAKAKANPAYRFYTLYDKIYRKDVLQEAWSRCRANDGSSGVDGQSFAGIEFKGVEAWLEQLAQELRTKTYRPQAVRRVNIPKADGKTRLLGIPTMASYCTSFSGLLGSAPF